jgi:two-component system nitrate/nitrite response regulator NarL
MTVMRQPKERPLTERQLEVARALAKGLSIEQIACELDIRPKTVRSHLNRLFWKAGVNRQRLLVETLISMGLIER